MFYVITFQGRKRTQGFSLIAIKLDNKIQKLCSYLNYPNESLNTAKQTFVIDQNHTQKQEY